MPALANLVVGRNSKIARELGAMPGVDVISHSDLPVDKTYNVVYVFSYSFNLAENERLLSLVSKLTCHNVVYVSSITAQLGPSHNYRYPTIKWRCEEIAKSHHFHILQIGLVPETMSCKPRDGDFLVTSLSDLRDMIASGALEIRPVKLLSYGDGPNKLQYYYGLLLDHLGQKPFRSPTIILI